MHTPSAAALAAAQGVDLADVAMVQPSPMAAEATVAALSALMRQPARQSSLQGRPRSGSGSLPSSATAAAAAGKQLLSFGDELEDGEMERPALGAAGSCIGCRTWLCPSCCVCVYSFSFRIFTCSPTNLTGIISALVRVATSRKRDLTLCSANADELEAGPRFGGGLAAATSKRFKHEKTLVMLNPVLSGEHCCLRW